MIATRGENHLDFVAIIGTSDRPCWLAEACKILLLHTPCGGISEPLVGLCAGSAPVVAVAHWDRLQMLNMPAHCFEYKV